MNATRIFCFWEPSGVMTPYLRLCMRTWAVNIPDYEVVVLDHANLDRYIRPGTYDMSALKRLTLGVQKDAIEVAVLQQHGGVFLDVDTIVTGDIAPVLRKLAHTGVVIFSSHMAFLAARPNAQVLTRLLEKVQARLSRVREGDPPPEWDYLGSGALGEVMADMIDESLAGRVYGAMLRTTARWPTWARAMWRRAVDPVWARRRGLFFRTVYRRYMTILDRKKYGFIAEAADESTPSPSDRYLRLWFESKPHAASVFRPNQQLIALHHSWTPEWYRQLTEEQALEHGCVLSTVLREILASERPAAPNAS